MSNNEADDDPFIPCEYCGDMIRFSQYDQHLRTMAPSYLLYRDDDDNAFYRINISPMIATFNALNIADSNVEPDEEDSDSDMDSQDSTPRILNRTNHRSLIVMPRVIPLIPDLINENDYNINSLISETIGTVRVGLSNPDLKELDNNDDNVTCPICQDIIMNGVHVQTKCHHSFCKECILKWFEGHVTCPICCIDQRTLTK